MGESKAKRKKKYQRGIGLFSPLPPTRGIRLMTFRAPWANQIGDSGGRGGEDQDSAEVI